MPADLGCADRVRHDESNNTCVHVSQAVGVKFHILQKGIPQSSLLAIFGKGLGKHVRQLSRDLGLSSFKGSSDCAGQPDVIEWKRPAEEPNVIEILGKPGQRVIVSNINGNCSLTRIFLMIL